MFIWMTMKLASCLSL